MFKNYFKTAWRNLLRNKVYSGLNILGLAIGMGVALLIGLWVMGQLSFDRFLPGYERAYQVRFNTSDKGAIRTQPEVCIPLADALKKDVPGIAHVAPAFGPVSNALTIGDKRIVLDGIIGGEEFFQIFQCPFLEGDPAKALEEPSSIVLTQSTARALFGNADAMNKIVLSYGNTPLKVTGIIQDLPRNSSLQFGFVTPFSFFAADGWVKAAKTNWNHTFFLMYMGLQPHADFDRVAAQSKMLVQKYAPSTYRVFQQQVFFQPLRDWHLYTEFKNGRAVGGLIDYVRLFSIIGILVLLIACINFMNLSTARSEKRAREVGVRKVIGSSRRGLILQFLVESLVITFLAFLLSLSLVQLALPAFNGLTHEFLRIPYADGSFWGVMMGYVLLTGLLAGSRPAFYLSSFQPVKVLKGAMQVGRSATLPRKVLVVLQFSCSIALIISTILIYQQVQYARSRPRGYDANRLLVTAAGGDYRALKQEVL
ncbi:MAG TPA: ABC transporter permease, partial [Puia sp.]|nr:ABC transporter permease [Puia sp.]